MLKTKTGRAAVFLLLLSLTISLALGISALADTAPKYDYVLVCTNDGTDGMDTADGTIVLKLYLKPDSVDAPILINGSFALRFPSTMSAVPYVFANSGNIEVRPVAPSERSSSAEVAKATYHAFGWTMLDIGSWELASEWDSGKEMLLIGTYTFTEIDSYPSKAAVGQKDWLKTDVAEPKEYLTFTPPKPIPPEADWGKTPFNLTVWNPETKLYQGNYDDGVNARGDLTQTDIGFIFDPPSTWKSAFGITSYDPKKPITVELEVEGTTHIIKVPIWNETDRDTAEHIAANGNEVNAGLGIGRYITEIDLGGFADVKLTPDENYTLVIKKPGHLKKTINVKAVSDSLSDAEFSESLEDPIYLPCGDINPVEKDGDTTYGDGKIKLNDRSILQAYINRQLTVPSKSVILSALDTEGEFFGNHEVYRAFLADLNGDGKITIADLNIMMAPENYNHAE